MYSPITGSYERFQSDQNSGLRYGKLLFMVRFKICPSGVAFKLRVSFLRFSEIALFCEKFINLLSEIRLQINCKNFNFKVQVLS